MITDKKNSKARQKIRIDYPKAGEKINSAHYAVRVSAAPCDNVEVSVDGGEWIPCANSSGYWWRQLSGLPEGKHIITARADISEEICFSIRKTEVAGAPR